MKKHSLYIFLIAFCLILNFVTLRGVWGDAKPNSPGITAATMPMESSHERAPFVSMLSLIESKRFDISKEYANFASPDVGTLNGKYFSYFPPAVSIWIIPFYLVGQYFNLAQVFAYYSMAVFSILSVILIYLISKNVFRQPTHLAFLNSFVFGFASTFWSYSTTIYQHGMTVFLLLLSFYAVWKYGSNKKFNWIWAGIVWFCFGISAFVDYPNVILFLPVMVYFLVKSITIKKNVGVYQIKMKTTVIFTSIVFLVLTFLHGYYNNVNFGNWKIVSNVLPRYTQKKNLSTADLKKKNIETEKFRIFATDRFTNGVYELTLAPDKGIFYFSPIFLVSILGVLLDIKKRKLESGILVSFALVNLFLYAFFVDPWGGWAFGPRYLIPSMAVLSVFIGTAIDSISRFKWIIKVITFILLGFSSSIALLGALTTNLVPPKGEAIYLKIKYGYLLNLDYIRENKTGSFLYTNYLQEHISLIQYFGIIFSVLLILIFLILFIAPIFSRSTSNTQEKKI